MRISKSLSFVCAVAVILPVSLRAADNPAQAKAREALRALSSQQGAPPAVNEAAKEQSAPVVQPKPVKPPSLATAQSAPVRPAVAPAEAAGIAKARESVRQTIAKIEAQGDLQQFSMPPAGSQTQEPKIEQAREAVREQLESMPAVSVSAEKPVAKDNLVQPSNYERLESPPVPFSKEKQARLADLLRRYRADEITPDEYHAERAKVIAAP